MDIVKLKKILGNYYMESITIQEAVDAILKLEEESIEPYTAENHPMKEFIEKYGHLPTL